MTVEDTRPQNSLSEAPDGLKSHKTNSHNTVSLLLICPRCLNTIQEISGVNRAVDLSRVVIQTTKNPFGKGRPEDKRLVWKLLV